MTNKTKTPQNFAEGYTLLQKEEREYKKPPFKNPRQLPLNAIRTAFFVFQPRHLDEVDHTIASEGHICELLDALQTSGGQYLDAITVYWSGQAYRIIDGHHRHEAYLRYYKQRPTQTVPVNVFEGNLEEAIQKAIELNSKNHLPLTKEERLDRAWLLVATDIGSKGSIARSCKVGTATVATMRQRLREMAEADPECYRENAMELSWAEAKASVKKAPKYDNDWKEAAAKTLAQRLGKNYGKRLAQHPEITARALEIYSENLTGELFRYWWGDFHEAVADEIENSDF